MGVPYMCERQGVYMSDEMAMVKGGWTRLCK